MDIKIILSVSLGIILYEILVALLNGVAAIIGLMIGAIFYNGKRTKDANDD